MSQLRVCHSDAAVLLIARCFLNAARTTVPTCSFGTTSCAGSDCPPCKCCSQVGAALFHPCLLRAVGFGPEEIAAGALRPSPWNACLTCDLAPPFDRRQSRPGLQPRLLFRAAGRALLVAGGTGSGGGRLAARATRHPHARALLSARANLRALLASRFSVLALAATEGALL